MQRISVLRSLCVVGFVVAAPLLACGGGGNSEIEESIDNISQAASVHLKGGANAEPLFTDNGFSLSASGSLAGLGEGNVVVALSAQGNVTSVCINPSGANQPPGQNPAPITLTGTQQIPRGEVKNGETPFNVSTTSAPSTIQGAPDCPNRKWTEAILSVSFTSATITVRQAGQTVLTLSCTFSTPTSDGVVAASNVTCTEQ
jgi:hypothetical protein